MTAVEWLIIAAVFGAAFLFVWIIKKLAGGVGGSNHKP
jgi:hypothetical protein